MKTNRTLGALALCVALTVPAAAFAQGHSPLQIVVYNIKKAVGTIRVAVCTIQTFLKDCPYEGTAPATLPTTTVTVAGLPPGTYAAQVFQDVNDNHKVDRNPLGIPKEGVGFSNDAPIHLSPPKFKDAAFEHGEEAQTIQIQLRYFSIPLP